MIPTRGGCSFVHKKKSYFTHLHEVVVFASHCEVYSVLVVRFQNVSALLEDTEDDHDMLSFPSNVPPISCNLRKGVNDIFKKGKKRRKKKKKKSNLEPQNVCWCESDVFHNHRKKILHAARRRKQVPQTLLSWSFWKLLWWVRKMSSSGRAAFLPLRRNVLEGDLLAPWLALGTPSERCRCNPLP